MNVRLHFSGEPSRCCQVGRLNSITILRPPPSAERDSFGITACGRPDMAPSLSSFAAGFLARPKIIA
jgi:hypothetical protein